MKLTITVAGPVKSGKSTVAYLIKQALDNVGIPAEISELDVSEETLENTALRRTAALGERGLTVTIEMVQTGRR